MSSFTKTGHREDYRRNRAGTAYQSVIINPDDLPPEFSGFRWDGEKHVAALLSETVAGTAALELWRIEKRPKDGEGMLNVDVVTADGKYFLPSPEQHHPAGTTEATILSTILQAISLKETEGREGKQEHIVRTKKMLYDNGSCHPIIRDHFTKQF